MREQEPLSGRAWLVECEGVADDAGRYAAMGLCLSDAGVWSHRGTDEEAVGGEGDQGLVDRGIIGRTDEASPDVELPGD